MIVRASPITAYFMHEYLCFWCYVFSNIPGTCGL